MSQDRPLATADLRLSRRSRHQQQVRIATVGNYWSSSPALPAVAVDPPLPLDRQRAPVGFTAFSLLTVRLVSSGITDRTCWRRQSPTKVSSGRSVVLTPTHHGSLLMSARPLDIRLCRAVQTLWSADRRAGAIAVPLPMNAPSANHTLPSLPRVARRALRIAVLAPPWQHACENAVALTGDDAEVEAEVMRTLYGDPSCRHRAHRTRPRLQARRP